MFQRTILILVLSAALALGVRPSHARRDAGHVPAFATEVDALIAGLLEQLPEVPGLALAVVVDDSVALVRGYGMADLEHGVASSADASYYIASATKPFTALAAALLHDRGEIDLDSSLTSHLAGSGMAPALVSPDVTLRDLLSHTAGLQNSPIAIRLAYTGEHTPDQLWRLLSSTEANETGPGAFQYTNFGYNLLTMITDRELGERWQDILQDEVFDPAGLDRTTAYASRPRERDWPLAAPYFGLHPDGLQRVPLEKNDATMQSAGGLMTTAEDAAGWMLLQINQGELDGRRVLPSHVIRATQESRIAPADSGRGPFHTTGCGLGWLHGSHAGRRVLHHSGGYPGFRSLISFMPDERVGVAVFVNEGSIGGRLPDALAVWAYDWWLDREPEDPAPAITAMRDRFSQGIAKDFARRAGREWTLELDRAAYTGIFVSDEYGALEILLNHGELTAQLGRLESVAEPFTTPNSVRVEMVPGSGEVLKFVVEDGTVTGIDYDGTWFRRK